MEQNISMKDLQSQMEGLAAVNQELVALSKEMIATLKQLSLSETALVQPALHEAFLFQLEAPRN